MEMISMAALSAPERATIYTYVADVIDRDGELVCERFSGTTRADAVQAAQNYCAPLTRRRLVSVQADWESAVLPGDAPLVDRIVARGELDARLAKATKKMRRFESEMIDLKAEIDHEINGTVLDIKRGQFKRVTARYDLAMGDVQRFSRAVAEMRAAMEMKQAAE